MAFIVVIIAIAILFLGIWKRSSKGRFGEKRVAHILGRLPQDRYRVINNLMLRTPAGSTTQIDHVVVSVYGIFAIETKFYNGWIYGGEDSEYWTQNIYGNKYRLRNPVYQNQGHIRALKSFLKDYGHVPYISIVAFSRQASLRISVNAPVVYWDQILSVINQFEDRCISDIQADSIFNRLLSANIDSKENRKVHIQNIRANEFRRDSAVAAGKCPRCGGNLVLRHGQYGDFYGCSNYPRCRYILK